MPVSERGATKFLNPGDYVNAPERLVPYTAPPRERPNTEVAPNKGASPRGRSNLAARASAARERAIRRDLDLLRKALRAAEPVVDSPAFRRLRALARAGGKWVPVLGEVLTAIDLARWLDDAFKELYTGGSWRQLPDCGTSAAGPIVNTASGQASTLAGSCSVIQSGDTSLPGTPGVIPPPRLPIRYWFQVAKYQIEAVNPYRQITTARFENMAYPNNAAFAPQPSPWPWQNPNVTRNLPSSVETMPPEAGQPAPGNSLEPAPKPQPAPEPNQQAREVTETGVRRIPSRHIRALPPRGTRERKSIAKSKMIVMGIFGAIDKISEAAEIVDAAFEALPKKVQDRWKQKARPGDSFGQYGIDGADWKLKALYYNYESIDIKAFARNVVQNEAEDQLVGSMQKYLPKNTVNAFNRSVDTDGDGRLEEFSPELFVSNVVDTAFKYWTSS